MNIRPSFAWLILPALVLWLCGPSVQISAAQQRSSASKTRIYYVAADEVAWDYAPEGRDVAMDHPFDDFQKNYMESGLHRIGRI